MPLVEPARLVNLFELLVNVYEPNSDGKLLVEWMKDDWQLFNHPAMDVAHAKELLGEILDNGEIVRRPFAPSPSYISEGLAQWETLRDELMYRNRWFLDMSIDEARLRHLLDLLLAPDLPRKWFRARIRTDDETYPIEKNGSAADAPSLTWSSQSGGHSLSISWLASRNRGCGDSPTHRRGRLRC